MREAVIFVLVGIALLVLSQRVIKLSDEVELAQAAIQVQKEYIEKFSALAVVLQKNYEERAAEAKAYAKELDRLAHDNIEIRALLGTALPPDTLCGLRSCRTAD